MTTRLLQPNLNNNKNIDKNYARTLGKRRGGGLDNHY